MVFVGELPLVEGGKFAVPLQSPAYGSSIFLVYDRLVLFFTPGGLYLWGCSLWFVKPFQKNVFHVAIADRASESHQNALFCQAQYEEDIHFIRHLDSISEAHPEVAIGSRLPKVGR